MIQKGLRFHGYGSLNYVYRQGKTVRGELCSLKYTPNSRRKTSRVAVVVSKKVHKSAVMRNRIRRRVYETVREYLSGIESPYDLVFVVYSEQLATIEQPKLKQLVDSQLKKAGII